MSFQQSQKFKREEYALGCDKVEKSFRDISRYLQLLLEQSTDGFWIRSADHKKIIYLSPGYATIWGRPLDDLYSMPDHGIDSIHADDQEHVIATRDQLAFRTTIKHHYRILLPNQQIRWIREKSFPVFYEGERVAYAGIVEDVTQSMRHELKALEKSRQCYEEIRSSFIANIRHDLRTPFTGISTIAEILLRAETDPQKKEYLEILYQSSQEFLAYINTLLEFDRLKNRNGSLRQKVTFNLKKLVDSVINIERAAVLAKGLELRYQFDSDIQPIVKSDEYKIKSILIHLLGNAIKFTNSGYIDVEVKQIRVEGHKSLIRFMVTDTGIGIPADKKELIFEDFSRLTPSYKGCYTGQGIGLSIVKQFARALKAELNVQSQIGVGSTFVLTVLLEQPMVTDLVDSIE